MTVLIADLQSDKHISNVCIGVYRTCAARERELSDERREGAGVRAEVAQAPRAGRGT